MTTLKDINFGVEIETYGIGREGAVNAIARALGWTASNGYRGGYKVVDNQGRSWKAVGDSSICGHSGAEVVSPILKYDDIEDLQKVVRALRQGGAKVNESCGIHIHVDAGAFEVPAIVRLAKLWARKEKLLKHSFEVFRARGESYCWDMNRHGFMDRLFAKRNVTTLDQLNKIWYDSDSVTNRHYHYDSSRYHACNLHNIWGKGTIEFRLFNSTLHAGKVKAYVQFCLAMASKAINARAAARNGRFDFNPATARYELWYFLRDLGLTGDEFKTCRLHLTKHLEGTTEIRRAVAA